MPVKTVLTTEEIEKMIGTARCQRDQLIMQFYSETGVRESELLSVLVENIDFDQHTVLIPHLKAGAKKHCPKCNHVAGRKTQWCSHCGISLKDVEAEGVLTRNRIITLSDELIDLLRDFTQGMELHDRVIKLSRQAIYNIIREMASEVGLQGKCILNPDTGRKQYVHPHILRASLAVDWLKIAGGDINKQKALQEQLGHSSFDTTMRYNKLAPSQVRKVADEVQQLRFNRK